MLLDSFRAGFAHGLLIVSAPDSLDDHDDWDPGESPVHAGPDSLYIGVQQDATGLVSVECLEGEESSDELYLLFEGRLSLPSYRLRLCDPNETISMILRVSGDVASVAVKADNQVEPSRISLYITPLLANYTPFGLGA